MSSKDWVGPHHVYRIPLSHNMTLLYALAST